MREITAWKVYKTVDLSGKEQNVLIGYDPQLKKGIVELVSETKEKEVNGYTLIGSHNTYFEGYQNLWMEWVSKHNINSITDISNDYE